jgi:hypothetical protein
MAQKNLAIFFEFEKYVLDHPRFAAKIPKNAVVVFQVKGDEAFNQWSRRLARKHSGNAKGPVVYVRISKMRPVRSRIAALKIERAA